MRLSEDKISHLSHVIYDALMKSGTIDKPADDAKLRRELKVAISLQMKKEDELEELVRKKVLSYSRKVVEGSAEWDVMFNKHYQEEARKKGKL